MGQILRSHRGTLTVSTRLLTDLEDILVPDDGASADDAAAIMERADQIRAAHGDPDLDPDLRQQAHDLDQHWLFNVADVHALHQLRSTAATNGDEATVDAHWVSRVRNAVDALILSWTSCEEFLDDLVAEGLTADPLTNSVREALTNNVACAHCERCQFMSLRDRLDESLDAAGFDGGPYYRTYVLGEFTAA